MPPMPVRAALARALLFLAALVLWHGPALAAVQVHFHSFNGSMFGGRYPHTFVVFEGTLDATGERIYENYGFSARVAGPAVLMGPVAHLVYSEDSPAANLYVSMLDAFGTPVERFADSTGRLAGVLA